MEITRIIPVQAENGHRFRAVFNTGEAVVVSPPTVLSYKRFQTAVLGQLGKLYVHSGAEDRHDGALNWQKFVSLRLDTSQPAGGQPPASKAAS